MKKGYSFHVSLHEDGMGLLSFLRDKLSSQYSVKLLKKAIDQKLCKVNGKIEQISTCKLKKNDSVKVDLEPLTEKKEKEEVKISVLFEDEYLLICNKPAGVVSENAAINKLLQHTSLQLVHRLDKETSGAIMLAKTNAAKEALEDLFLKKTISKIYLAICDGIIKKNEGVMETSLALKGKQGGKVVYESQSNGKSAITFWKCLKRGTKASLVVCEPKTGRTHQLRVHLSEMGHPILGDLTYGKRFICAINARRHLLHAYRLSFIHPFTKKQIEILAPLPQDFAEALKVLFPDFKHKSLIVN